MDASYKISGEDDDLESVHRPDPFECLPNRTSTISVGFYTKDHTDPLTHGRV